jgi:hypothetical protein
MARDTLGYQYTGEDDTSWMPGGENDDDNIIERLGESSKTCRHTRPARSPSIPQLIRRTRSVAELSVRVLIVW